MTNLSTEQQLRERFIETQLHPEQAKNILKRISTIVGSADDGAYISAEDFREMLLNPWGDDEEPERVTLDEAFAELEVDPDVTADGLPLVDPKPADGGPLFRLPVPEVPTADIEPQPRGFKPIPIPEEPQVDGVAQALGVVKPAVKKKRRPRSHGPYDDSTFAF